MVAPKLTYTYPRTAAPAIANLNFAIAPGEIFGFLGPSGAGKSTTQNVLIGLRKGYHGSVKVIGREMKTWGADYYERIGVSFELPNHFLKLTALENLRYFGALYHSPPRDPRAVLELVGLSANADTPVAQFSKGMQGRLNLARALAHEPELLFLDEPTSGLDPTNVQQIRALIRAQRDAGRTVVLTTHNMAVAEDLCDRVAFIVDGQLRLIDTPRALRLRYGEPSVRVEYGQGQAQSFPLADLGKNQGFLQLLCERPIQTIHSQEATLDEIFIRVTGRRLA
ncbi:MAG: ABC transporter ATP-binding protein [Roseiflexaceae bacterium]|nr:ABC transporter ATP-binding protein [Roseiflexaceae bacterium]